MTPCRLPGSANRAPRSFSLRAVPLWMASYNVTLTISFDGLAILREMPSLGRGLMWLWQTVSEDDCQKFLNPSTRKSVTDSKKEPPRTSSEENVNLTG